MAPDNNIYLSSFHQLLIIIFKIIAVTCNTICNVIMFYFLYVTLLCFFFFQFFFLEVKKKKIVEKAYKVLNYFPNFVLVFLEFFQECFSLLLFFLFFLLPVFMFVIQFYKHVVFDTNIYIYIYYQYILLLDTGSHYLNREHSEYRLASQLR